MRIIVQFTFFTTTNGFLFFHLVFYRSYQDDSVDVSLQLSSPYFQRSCESSMNPTEMPITSESHKNIGGGEEGEQWFSMHITFVLGKKVSSLGGL